MTALRTLLLPLGLLRGAAPPASAADYSVKPVTLIVPFAAGGTNDKLSRILAGHLSKTLGQTIVMDSMGKHGVAPHPCTNLKYDPAQIFTPIGLIADLKG